MPTGYTADIKDGISLKTFAMNRTAALSTCGTYSGCELQIRRMECFSMLTKRDDGPLQGAWFLDVLDEQGDILDTLEVNAKGVKYMRRTLFMGREGAAS